MQARAELGDLRKPGLLSLPATKKAYQVELLRIHRYGLDAISAEKQAKLDLQDAELRKKEPDKFIAEFFNKRNPEHAARFKELGQDLVIYKMARELFVSRLEESLQRQEASKKAQAIKVERSLQREVEPREQDRDFER